MGLTKRVKMVDIVFDGFPSPEGARLIEVESTATRESRSVGTWLARDDGAVVLRLTADDVAKCDDEAEDRDALVRLSKEVLPE